jgi:hypothetical protein
MDEDDFDFSDPDLDDLPANTLHQIEANALRATQHQAAVPESDYGLGDGDEVINLDDDGSQYPHAAQQDGDLPNDGDHDQMGVAEQPRPTQADAGQLLLRIKKVRHLLPLQHMIQLQRTLLMCAARAGQVSRAARGRRPQGPAADQGRRGRHAQTPPRCRQPAV